MRLGRGNGRCAARGRAVLRSARRLPSRTEPIVMSLAGSEVQAHGQSVCTNSGVQLTGQSASRTADVLLSVFRDAGPMLVHALDRRIDHLHRRIISSGQRLHDPVPDAGPPPANEPIVASRTGSVGVREIRHGAPDRKTQNVPLRTRRSFTRGPPRGLFGSIGLMTLHSQSLSS
jgi:hypothetical protein